MKISGPRELGSEAGAPPPPELPGWAVLSREESTKALEAFEPETPQPDPSRSAVTISSSRPPVSLAALKAAGIQISGDEAIAIGQALCRAFITAPLLRRINDSDTTSVSSPVTTETVFIDANGRVDANVSDSHDAAAAIQSVGKVLSDIFPPHLRLFLQTKIVASPPQFETLDELSKALAAYEHPDGRELIQALYERAVPSTEIAPTEVPTTQVLTAAVATSAVATSIAPATTPTTSLPESKPAAPSRSKYHPLAVAAALVVGAIAIVGVSGWLLITRWSAAKSTVAVLPARSVAPATGATVPEPAPTLFKDALADPQNPAGPVPLVARAERPVVSIPPVAAAGTHTAFGGCSAGRGAR